MTTRVLPTLTDGTTYYGFDVILEGSSYGFELQWNERDSSWYCALYDAGGALLCSAVRVVIGSPLFNRPGLFLTPPGQVIAIDADKTGVEAGLYDLGSRVVLFYVESVP